MNFIQNFEQAVFNFLYSLNSVPLNTIMIIITNCASAIMLIFLSIVLYIVFRKTDKRIAKYIIINLVLVTVINTILKYIIARPRPNTLQIITEIGYSFPSAHAMIGFAFYGFLIYLIYKNVKNKKIKLFSIFALSMLIFTIGISRVYLGVHYITDVIAGFIFALIYLILFIKFIYKK